MDGFTHAIRTAAVDQRRQDAAVGGAGADILKRDVAWVVGVVGNQQDVVLPRLCVIDVAMLCGIGTITTVNHIAA